MCERKNNLREKRKAAGICVTCGKNPARPNRTMCEACARKRREQAAKPEYRANAREAGRRFREKRRAQGICICCGKRPAVAGITSCEICRKAMNARRMANKRNLPPEKKAQARERDASYQKERIAILKGHGLCIQCGQEKAEPGHVYCWACLLYRRQLASGYVDHAHRRMKGKRKQGICDAYIN